MRRRLYMTIWEPNSSSIQPHRRAFSPDALENFIMDFEVHSMASSRLDTWFSSKFDNMATA